MLQSDHQPHHSTINRPEEVGRMETMGYSKRSTASRNLLGWGWGRDHPDTPTVERQQGSRVKKLSFGMKPAWTPIHTLPPTKLVILGSCLSSLGLSFQMCVK